MERTKDAMVAFDKYGVFEVSDHDLVSFVSAGLDNEPDAVSQNTVCYANGACGINAPCTNRNITCPVNNSCRDYLCF